MTDRLEAIAIFAAVAEHGSFAEAARRMRRTPAAATRAVAALEEQLQTRLFNRTTRSVALTESGVQYLEIARRLIGTYAELTRLDGDSAAAPHGTLSVTAPAMFGRLHVTPLVGAFVGRYPQVDARLLLLDRVVSLIDEGMDVGVRLGTLPDSSLRAIRVGEVRMGIYGSPDYLARRGEPSDVRELTEHDTISCLPLTPTPDRWTFDSGERVAVRPRLTVNTADAAAELAAAGLGLAMLVSYQADAYVQAGRLRQVLTTASYGAVPIHLVHPSGRYVPLKVRLFLDHAAEGLRRRFSR